MSYFQKNKVLTVRSGGGCEDGDNQIFVTHLLLLSGEFELSIRNRIKLVLQTFMIGMLEVSGSPRHGKVRVGNNHEWGLGLDKPLNTPITKHVEDDAGDDESAAHDKLFK